MQVFIYQKSNYIERRSSRCRESEPSSARDKTDHQVRRRSDKTNEGHERDEDEDDDQVFGSSVSLRSMRNG